MKRTSMYTAVLALSLAMALAGGGLACRTFRERLDALEEQAVLQHQRNVCGLEDAFAAEYDTRSGAGYLSSGADSVCARVGQAYTRGQWLILGSSTAAFALMREGDDWVKATSRKSLRLQLSRALALMPRAAFTHVWIIGEVRSDQQLPPDLVPLPHRGKGLLLAVRR